MYSLMSFAVIIAFVALIIGLIRPAIVVRWGTKQTRGRVLLYYGLGILLLTFIAELVKPEEIRERERQEKVERLEKERERKAKEREKKEKERQEQLQQAQSILEKARQQLNLAHSAYKSEKFKEAIDSAQEAVGTLKNVRDIPEVATLNDEAMTLLADAKLEKARQQLNLARSAYESWKFKEAIDSAQEAVGTLKSVRDIPEVATLNDEAMTLLADAREALENAPDYILSANQLAREYENNEVAADIKYKGKIVLVSGTLQDIGKGLFGAPYIIIGGSGFLDGVQCSFTESDASSIARLYKGQNVRVKGEVSGLSIGSVMIKESSLQ